MISHLSPCLCPCLRPCPCPCPCLCPWLCPSSLYLIFVSHLLSLSLPSSLSLSLSLTSSHVFLHVFVLVLVLAIVLVLVLVLRLWISYFFSTNWNISGDTLGESRATCQAHFRELRGGLHELHHRTRIRYCIYLYPPEHASVENSKLHMYASIPEHASVEHLKLHTCFQKNVERQFRNTCYICIGHEKGLFRYFDQIDELLKKMGPADVKIHKSKEEFRSICEKRKRV